MAPETARNAGALSITEFIPPSEERLTAEYFWQMYGDVSGLTEESFFRMRDASSDLGSTYGYHNQMHPLEMLWVAMKWCDALEAQGVDVNRKVIIGGVFYHDKGYHEDHTALGFESKEEYATFLFANDAPSLGYTDDESGLTQDAIITTRKGEVPKTPEGLVMVLADLWNVPTDYAKGFAPRTLAFADETKMKAKNQGKDFDMSAFLGGSICILCEYVCCLLDQEICDVSQYVDPAVANLARMLREVAELVGLSQEEYMHSLANPFVYRLLSAGLPKDQAAS